MVRPRTAGRLWGQEAATGDFVAELLRVLLLAAAPGRVAARVVAAGCPPGEAAGHPLQHRSQQLPPGCGRVTSGNELERRLWLQGPQQLVEDLTVPDPAAIAGADAKPEPGIVASADSDATS
jgi:hypothetical protein